MLTRHMTMYYLPFVFKFSYHLWLQNQFLQFYELLQKSNANLSFFKTETGFLLQLLQLYSFRFISGPTKLSFCINITLLLESPASLTSKLLGLSAAIVQEHMGSELFCTFKIELIKNHSIKIKQQFQDSCKSVESVSEKNVL